VINGGQHALHLPTFVLYITNYAPKYSPTETLVEFGFGCKFNDNNRRIRFYHQVIMFVINEG
jgi:hypothetical protein